MQASLTHTIGRGTFWYTLNTVLTKIIGLVTMFFVLRTLSVYEYGLVELVLTVIGVFSIFRLPGISDTVIADMARERGRENYAALKNIFHNYLILQFFLGIIAWAIIFWGANLLAPYYGGVSALISIISFSFLFSIARTAYTTLFSVHLQFFTQSLHTFLEELAKLIFVFVFIFIFEMGPQGLVLAIVLSQGAALIAILPLFIKSYQPLSKINTPRTEPPWALLLAHGKWSLFSNYLSGLSQNMRVWFIKLFLGTEAVGLFAVASGLLSHVSSLVPIGQVIRPILPQYLEQKERFYRIIGKGIKYQLLGYFALFPLAYFVFPPLISALFPNYVVSLPFYKVLLVTLIPISFAATFTSLFTAVKEQKKHFYSVVALCFSVAIFSLLLLPVFGIWGIVYEFIITTIISNVAKYHYLKKIYSGFSLSRFPLFSFDSEDFVVLEKIKVYFKNNFFRFR
jgi:O-antigen/teichoic acid export membrane protein